MPKESLSVYLTAVDGMSPVFASITDKTKALDKESQELQQTYEALQKANKGLIERKTELQKQLKLVNEEVKEAEKSFKALDDEASSDALNKAIEKQQKLKDEIAGTTKAIQENRKAYKENIETIRKGNLEEQGIGLSDIAKGIFAGEVGQMFASSLGGLGQSALTSAIGTTGASLISDTLSGIISGGAAGAMFGLPGIAAGAALGGVSGLISGGTKIFEAEDDAFRDYYGGLYDDVKGRSVEMVESGSTLASGRQTDLISFKTMFGDEGAAKQYLSDLTVMANTTPFLYDDLVSMSKTLATYGYDESNILPLLETIGDTGAALGLGTSDMSAVAQALGRMKSSDKAALEYLNMLNDRGIGAVGMLAEAKGVSQGDMYNMISKGAISGTEAVEIITAALSRDKKEGGYRGAMEEQSQTFAGLSSTLEGLQQNLDALGGQGYNTLRAEGIQEEINALQDGDLGDAIGKMNAILGENQARKENLQDQYMREVLDAVLNGNKGTLFDAAQQNELAEMAQKFAELYQIYEDSERNDAEAGAQLEALYERAQILGQEYYDNSGLVKILNDTEIDEIEAIRQATMGLTDAYTALYDLNQTMSKGLVVRGMNPIVDTLSSAGGAFSDWISRAFGGASDEDIEKIQAGRLQFDDVRAQAHGHAFGLSRVPYDEYPALLHRDERVLTASEAKAQDAGQGGGPSISISDNTFVGTTEEMADQLFEIIMRKLEQTCTAAAPK